jgi:hypothetical protein
MQSWGDFGSQELITESDVLVLPLSKEAMRLYLSDDIQREWEFYRLYVEAEGYAAVASQPMRLVGEGDTPPPWVLVEFSEETKARLPKGHVLEMELVLRESQSKYLCFADDNDQPVPGVEVKSYVFWATLGHCGALQGELLAQDVSGQDGCVSIPDGEFQYAFELWKPHFHLNIPSWDGLMRLITYLPDQRTVVSLHRLRKQPLEMIVQRNETPVADVALEGQWFSCPCGLCAVSIATTDEEGRISVEDFYPEEWSYLFVRGEDEFLWKADPRRFSGTKVVVVELRE